MTRRRKNDDIYYGNLPSNYLANLGKELVKSRLESLKKADNKCLNPSEIVKSAGGDYFIDQKEMNTTLNNIYNK